MNKKYIVIGTSAAGIGFLNKLVQLEPHADIICISNEKELPYNKCFLADYLAQRGDRNRIYTKNLDFFKQHNISLLLHTEVHMIDAAKQCITTSNGQFSYDCLFLGLGASPVKPPISYPADAQGIFSFYNLADITSIERYISENSVKRIAVVGAGLSGLECADALYHRGYACTVIDRSHTVLSSLLNYDAALFLENHLRKYITIQTRKSVRELLFDHKKIKGALFDDGSKIEAEMIVFALGSRPNISLAKQAGITIEQNAILANHYLQTNIPTIFAAGDCIITTNQITGQLIRSCTWPDAMLQGLIAAQNCAGQQRAYPGVVPLVSSQFFDIQFASTGLLPELSSVVKQQSSIEYEAILSDSNQIKGFQLVGSAKQLSTLKRALFSGHRV